MVRKIHATIIKYQSFYEYTDCEYNELYDYDFYDCQPLYVSSFYCYKQIHIEYKLKKERMEMIIQKFYNYKFLKPGDIIFL